jgi:predicted phosphodiesterase
MRVAVISDIHANRQALEAVLAATDAIGADELWCLGDLVGYGADPNDCVQLVREHASVCLAGNHDLAVTGELRLDDFSRGAALAARWTLDVIGDSELEWLSSLSSKAKSEEVGLFHGSPRDPVWEYVISTLLADLCFDTMRTRTGLIGHSHVALAFHRTETELATGDARRGGDSVNVTLSRPTLRCKATHVGRGGGTRVRSASASRSATPARGASDVDRARIPRKDRVCNGAGQPHGDRSEVARG